MSEGRLIFENDDLVVYEHQYGDVTFHFSAVSTVDPGQREALGLALLGLSDRRQLAEKIAAAASEVIFRELT